MSFYDVPAMRSATRWAAIFTALLATAMTVSGCGLSKPTPAKGSVSGKTSPATTPPTSNYRYLTHADFAKYAVDSPARAALEFWWDIQYQDFYRAYGRLSRSFQRQYGKGVQRFATLVMAEYGHWLGNDPHVIDDYISGSSATVVTRYTPPGFPPSRTPYSFSLVREGEQWKIAYNFYLATRLSA
jgi:hypothetical protein